MKLREVFCLRFALSAWVNKSTVSLGKYKLKTKSDIRLPWVPGKLASNFIYRVPGLCNTKAFVPNFTDGITRSRGGILCLPCPSQQC